MASYLNLNSCQLTPVLRRHFPTFSSILCTHAYKVSVEIAKDRENKIALLLLFTSHFHTKYFQIHMNCFHISYEVVTWRASYEKRTSLHTQIDLNRYTTHLLMSAMWKDSI